MRVMALDTTVRGGSVALVALARGRCIVDERPGDSSRSHAERLPGEIAAVIDAHGLVWADIDLFAVAAGPGSFTGLRIGISTIQGLALTVGRPLVAVSALEALAQCASERAGAGRSVAAWMDAHRGEVFAALYRVMPAPIFDPERIVEVEGPTVGHPLAVIERVADHLPHGPAVFVGDGAVLYAASIERRWPSQAGPLPQPLLAGAIGRMALARATRGDTIHPSSVRPLYVRRPDAELDRERKAIDTKDTKGTKGWKPGPSNV
ncbi:MAG: tRNA (adenosine(37)-N6)-threonylcarbamoyltransferase complex dimerization subunit type 1 TsaB [Acidobacteria bacterium RIFCSPLOWO2_12_FULL_65_11]|nr:MAG: tRNA (adenosine(37)-N6)-threonylcarbamoyltransferase complex dimerization subunit type 1 TsaB [Acidobacteria bacterium RIFCSPLOWO2_02_FULL_64_15]OFW32265.1 MAG: tRNA (adenosine(37)-N6)-threonylcarbamoyltransferase complex dimerization subunit type 1 TsaB [Acidobacteria bacterium RIFCSPLOWO2_12_FULL_65_11]